MHAMTQVCDVGPRTLSGMEALQHLRRLRLDGALAAIHHAGIQVPLESFAWTRTSRFHRGLLPADTNHIVHGVVEGSKVSILWKDAEERLRPLPLYFPRDIFQVLNAEPVVNVGWKLPCVGVEDLEVVRTCIVLADEVVHEDLRD